MFDRVAILDWSAARGPKRGKDSIWLGLADISGTRAENIPTRMAAARRLEEVIDAALANGHRLLIGADFAFGFPAGFAKALTGVPSALAVWDWLSARILDTPENISNYREVAAEMNSGFAGAGPFWGNGMRLEVPGLPRLKPPLPPPLIPHRHCDLVARGDGVNPKTVWQLAGAGAVGAQVLTGLPVLNALRRRHPSVISVWPFEVADTPIVLAEVYPSLLRDEVRLAVATGQVVDEAQVSLLAAALLRLSSTHGLKGLMKIDAEAAFLAEEGWLLAAGQAALLSSEPLQR